jgi:two-component system sensor histidine kinase KdpD
MARGTLRIYLGAAPGVGKTFAMLDEGHRRATRGTDVVVGLVEDHGRARTRLAAEGLETVPRSVVEHRGGAFTELDLDAVLARHPEVALVDELAHTNVPGSKNEKRWQDVEELLVAGIDVITTINVQHLASLNDVVEKITGVPQRETVPDEVVRRADQVDLVDMSPEALRRRLAHGNVYAADKVDAALGNYFRLGNLTALRELALLWLADRVEEGMQAYRQQQGIEATWETRERVVVALTGGPEGETLLRRAARIAARSAGGDLLAVHVERSDGLRGASPDQLARQRRLAESLGGSYHLVVGEDEPTALLDFARSENATQLVVGASRRTRLSALASPGIGQAVVRGSGSIDVHLVTHERAGAGHRGLPGLTGGLTVSRRLAGLAVAVLLLPGLTLLLTHCRSQLGLSSQLLLFLLSVVFVALVGGLYPALVAAVAAAFLVNFWFTPPLHTLRISTVDSVLALAVFTTVAVAVSTVVDLAARRARQAARAGAEAMTLATLSGDVLRGGRTLPSLLDRVRELFLLTGAALYEHDHLVAASGDVTAGGTATEVKVDDHARLVLIGRPLAADDLRILGVLAAQAAVSLERGRLKAQADEAGELAEVDRQRTSLLAAVGHDLRTPLSAAKAAVTGLRSTDVSWSPDEHDELLATADESLDQLNDVVTNLLDMSRLQVGALAVQRRSVALDEVVPTALAHLGAPGGAIAVEISDDLPEVLADPGLLERVLVNLVANALRHSPTGTAVRLCAAQVGERVQLRISDQGPGVPDALKEEMFVAFQRLHDRSTSATGPGVGLGLAISRGFVEAMQGRLEAEDTPGGGLTMTVELPVAGQHS